MAVTNLRLFRKKVAIGKRALRRFLTGLETIPSRELDRVAAAVEPEVWKEVQCLTCANCCREMTPTYTPKDIVRIASHLGMGVKEMKDKWLYKQRGTGDWLNRSIPCQFLDLHTNMCTIYEVRPEDCAGFPHLKKKRMAEYLHVHKQNVEMCPATYRLVEKMMELERADR